MPDPTSRTAALEAGDIDIAVISNPADAARLENRFTVLRNWDVTPNALLVNVRPTADGGGAIFYSVVSRDSLDAEYAAHRQRFLAEQGYGYVIKDADDLLGPAI